MTDSNFEIPDWQAELDRRERERRDQDRERHRTLIMQSGLIFGLLSALVALAVAWGTSTAAIAQKVDKADQLKVDAGFDARISVNTIKIDGIQQSLYRLQVSVDSVNTRLRQMACDGQSPSCR